MTAYEIYKYLHIVGACVLLGTGAGIAFFMLAAHQTGKAAVVAAVAPIVVTADYIFTATAVVLQPITGYLLVREVGYPMSEGWVVLSLILYVAVGALWLPVVWIQLKLRGLAREAAANDAPLPERYHLLFGRWFVMGVPAFMAVLAILWLMIVRPHFTF